MLGDFGSPPPNRVHGFDEARGRRLLPEVPGSPPPLLPGLTAGQLANRTIVGLVAAFIGFFVLASAGIPVLRGLGVPRFLATLSVGVSGAVALGVLAWAWRGVGEKNLLEFQRGYTTLTLTYGTFWLTRGPRWRMIPWDYRGLWQFTGDGRLRSAPDTGVLPPGLYPSSIVPGGWECWSGAEWTRCIRPAPVDRMDAGAARHRSA